MLSIFKLFKRNKKTTRDAVCVDVNVRLNGVEEVTSTIEQLNKGICEAGVAAQELSEGLLKMKCAIEVERG